MTGRPWLLLTSSPPGRLGVGQLYVRSLCRLMPPGSIAVAALLAPDENWTTPDDVQLFDQLRLERRYEFAYRPRGGPVGAAAAAAGVHFCLRSHARKLTDATVAWGQRIGAGGVIGILDGPTSMLMAADVASRLDVPLYPLVWDAAEHVMARFGHASWSARQLQQGFDAALRSSAGVAVMSDAMRERYSADYGARCTIVRQPIDDEWITARRPSPRHSSDDFVIGFAGSVTAREEVELLCRTLDAENWLIANRRVHLRVFGLRFVCQGQAPRWIEYRGYLPGIADVVAGLSECDVLFLPQPFGPAERAFAEYSFPTKMTTYLAAGRPLLLLAPEWSALARFCRAENLPVVCDQPETGAVLEHLQRLATDSGFVGELKTRLESTAVKFGLQPMQDRVEEWLCPDDLPARTSTAETSRREAVSSRS